MTEYIFTGVVLPERAQISFNRDSEVEHIGTGMNANIAIKVLLNQISVWLDTESETNIYDLKNIVANCVRRELSIFGFIKGYAYDVDISRVQNRQKNIDTVFGIDIPIVSKRTRDDAVIERVGLIYSKCSGDAGVLLGRCFEDLRLAMKFPGNPPAN